jgi:hypothetical protein
MVMLRKEKPTQEDIEDRDFAVMAREARSREVIVRTEMWEEIGLVINEVRGLVKFCRSHIENVVQAGADAVIDDIKRRVGR